MAWVWAALAILLFVVCVVLVVWTTRKRDELDDVRRKAARDRLDVDKLERRDDIRNEPDPELLERLRAVRRKRNRDR